ncbi:hypothetical protein FQA47_004369 [Oryzias melastigma]|uniref:Uncharacterized protein n=1 Tax=Oryzias melastigma TaxID=30732 RepID=A0A834FIX3_ORYME|nr:hypothetical protein FQA47_004369 [Oryzias melastigma]
MRRVSVSSRTFWVSTSELEEGLVGREVQKKRGQPTTLLTTETRTEDQKQRPGSCGDQNQKPGSCGDQDQRPGSCGDQNQKPGSCGDQDQRPGSCGDQGQRLGSCGDQDQKPGSCGDQDQKPGSSKSLWRRNLRQPDTSHPESGPVRPPQETNPKPIQNLGTISLDL